MPGAVVTPAPLAGSRGLFVSWISHHGRSADLAEALGVEAAFVAVGRLADRRTAPARHAVQAVRTLILLVRRRPRVLLVMAPPATLVLLALAWQRLTGCRLVVDCHSGAVLPRPGGGRPLSARLAARADLAVVTLPSLTAGLPGALALHDPPVTAVPAPLHGAVVLPASWYTDEPWADVLDAARLLPEVRFALTGRAPAGLQVPPNVTLTGFLDREAYDALLAGAAVVLALTTRPDTMQRAAYEAIGAGRPVVASDHPGLRDYLGPAGVPTAGGGADLARAVRAALDDADRLAAAAVQVRERQAAVFADGLAALVAAVRDRPRP